MRGWLLVRQQNVSEQTAILPRRQASGGMALAPWQGGAGPGLPLAFRAAMSRESVWISLFVE